MEAVQSFQALHVCQQMKVTAPRVGHRVEAGQAVVSMPAVRVCM